MHPRGFSQSESHTDKLSPKGKFGTTWQFQPIDGFRRHPALENRQHRDNQTAPSARENFALDKFAKDGLPNRDVPGSP
jgi:hypothetical protein